MVFADEKGKIYDHPELSLAGSAAGRWEAAPAQDCIPLPEGSELFLLPGRLPVGVDDKGAFQVMEEDPWRERAGVTAVAVFMAPAHTATLWAAYRTLPGAPNLPLFAYAAVGFSKGKFVVCGLRTDPLPRQDPGRFPPDERVANRAQRLMERYEDNRLWQHLGTCALTYGCPAARNLMLERWEAPLPTSPICNASCLGCLSSQPQGTFPCTQPRMTFTPSPLEVAQVAGHHFSRGREPLASFGQGCEGEPLMQGELLADSITMIRRKHPHSTLNLNTNGSRPQVVAKLMKAGLSSIRVSLNSLLPQRHQDYYQPRGWSLEDALQSLSEVKKAGGFASINLLTMPGLTDQPAEVEALCSLIEKVHLDLIQWRNLNIDPEIYLRAIKVEPPEERLGMPALIAMLKRRYPRLRHGYFNPLLRPGAQTGNSAEPA